MYICVCIYTYMYACVKECDVFKHFTSLLSSRCYGVSTVTHTHTYTHALSRTLTHTPTYRTKHAHAHAHTHTFTHIQKSPLRVKFIWGGFG